MLSTEDQAQIKRLIAEAFAESRAADTCESCGTRMSPRIERSHARMENAESGYFLEDLETRNGTFVSTSRIGGPPGLMDRVIEVTARAFEVLGTREKVLRWFETPVPSLGNRTPLSMLGSPEGVAEVNDTLGAIEHGTW